MDILTDKPIYTRNPPGSSVPARPASPASEEKSPAIDTKSAQEAKDNDELPSYLTWLDSGKDSRPFLQALLVKILQTQLRSSSRRSAHLPSARWWSPTRIYAFALSLVPWMTLPAKVVLLALECARISVRSTWQEWTVQLRESDVFRNAETMKVPKHSTFLYSSLQGFELSLVSL